jgi:hypothetical protein
MHPMLKAMDGPDFRNYAGRRRYFTINWIQFATTWAAFALFLVALGSL